MREARGEAGVTDTRDVAPALWGLSVRNTRWVTLSAQSLLDVMSRSMGRLEMGRDQAGGASYRRQALPWALKRSNI